jgi:hypothetical protein
VTLKEKVFEHIQKHGPKTSAELVTVLKVKKASLRRTCGELIREGKLAPLPTKGDRRLYGVAADVREPAVDVVQAPRSTAAPSPADKKVEPPADPADWRMTDFTF